MEKEGEGLTGYLYKGILGSWDLHIQKTWDKNNSKEMNWVGLNEKAGCI